MRLAHVLPGTGGRGDCEGEFETNMIASFAYEMENLTITSSHWSSDEGVKYPQGTLPKYMKKRR